MPTSPRPRLAVVLPGSGSDDAFVRSAFASPLRRAGFSLVTPRPVAGPGVVEGYLTALDRCLRQGAGPVVVGGVSLGAHVAAAWAAQHPDDVAGLLCAMPAWTGAPDGAPAALVATMTATLVEDRGLDAAVTAARAGADGWLADELARAWAGYGAGLPSALRAAAATPAPGIATLRSLTMPAAVVGMIDDPVHPLSVAATWAGALARGVLHTTTLAALGADPAVLGRCAVGALTAACAERTQGPRCRPAPPPVS